MKLSKLKLTTPYLDLDELFYDKVEPTPLEKPFLISASKDAARLLDVKGDIAHDEWLVDVVNGTRKLDGSTTFAMCYAGYQFGYFVPRLGDGRAINLGKVNGQNLQLKGSGLTEYSRQGDGRAVLRSSVREYLMSEAMHGLGIETSRALALIGSDTDVARQSWEKGAIVLRLSPTWIRFGTFEYFAASGEHQKLQQLADYVIDESFPELKDETDMYLKMFTQIVKNTASTIARWQSVGFNHGVMNTDNMSIDGRTIDYGPFAFLDDYQSNYVCNHTDHEGRYSFRNQPGIAKWNLEQLARALSPILSLDKATKVIEEFVNYYEDEYLDIMYDKMGLHIRIDTDLDLFVEMLEALEATPTDYTKFFRILSKYDGNRTDILELVVFKKPLQEWLDSYDERLKLETQSVDERNKMMLGVNPKFILKNHLLQEAIEKANIGDFSMIDDMLKVVLTPFDEHHKFNYLTASAPDNAKNIKLSCSS
ncbi:YdiU family protein [Sulfurimonas sp.]|nr:YdiU family protein [Sulfurimonas sp.]